MALYLGTCGWSYPKGAGRWDGVFYPDGLSDRDKLSFYARYFNAVEVNSSFYRPPSPEAAKAWAKKVPSHFRFSAKLWQKFTHPKMFEQATGEVARLSEEDFEVFTAGLAPLAEAGRLGVLVAQFPASFKPDEGSLDYLMDLIRRFRKAGFRLAVELRHRDWTDAGKAQGRSTPSVPPVQSLLEDEEVAWVMIDEPKFRTSIRGVPLTGQLGYFRFHGRNYQQWWRHESGDDRYNYLYTRAQQDRLASDVREVADKVQDTYVFYNNHYRAKAVVNAVQLQLALGQPPTAPLPDTLLAEYGELREVQPNSQPVKQGALDLAEEAAQS